MQTFFPSLALLLSLAAICFASPVSPEGDKLVPVGTIPHPELKEPSGMVQCRIDPEFFWVHNDSGDIPRLFGINLKGEVIVPPWLARRGFVGHPPGPGETLYPGMAIKMAALNDWEDIAWMDEKLYIAETGNNGNARRDIGLYELFEPNPGAVEEATVFRFIPVAYPDQKAFPPAGPWNFDCEAIFGWGGKIYFITKNRPVPDVSVPGNSANLYRLDTMVPLQVNFLTPVDSMENTGGWVTAADSNEEGTLMAMMVQAPEQSIWLFDTPRHGDRFFSDASRVRRLKIRDSGQLESLTFYRKDGKDEIVVLNEERQLFRIPLSRFEEVR
ncbi:MAG: hypothetical protein WC314_27920 [Vulcanimicrobiota bacterium]